MYDEKCRVNVVVTEPVPQSPFPPCHVFSPWGRAARVLKCTACVLRGLQREREQHTIQKISSANTCDSVFPGYQSHTCATKYLKK